MASGAVISTLTGIPLNVCLLAAGAVTIIYTTLGGMIADQITDLVQFLIILVGLAVATPIVLVDAGGWAAIAAKLPAAKLSFTAIGWVTIIGYIFNYFCTFLSGPEMVSRFASAKDEKTAKGSALLSAVLMAAMSIFPALLGLAAFALQDQIPNISAKTAMMDVTNFYAPPLVTGIISAAIISATMSSADSNLLCMSSIFINDIYRKFINKKEMSEKTIIFATRLSNVIACLVAMCITFFGIDIVTLNTFAFAIRCAGPFAAYGLGLVVPRAIKASGIISIVAGTIGVVVWQILSGGSFYLGLLPVVFGCAVGTLAFFITNWIGWAKGVEPAPSAYLSDEEAAKLEA
jgi:SSS family solute:Na+ symporter